MKICADRSLTICNEVLHAPIHICAFFDSRDDQYEVIIPYIKEGLDKKEKVINILEGAAHPEHLRRLSAAGINTSEEMSSKQLSVLATEDTYLLGGNFAAEKMLQLLDDALNEAYKQGFESVRACGEMIWALQNLPGTDELIEYEARLNLLTPKHCCSLVCMYDVNRFSGRVLADVLATHSHVIMSGRIHQNPYYVEPLNFLSTLQRRRQSSLKSGI